MALSANTQSNVGGIVNHAVGQITSDAAAAAAVVLQLGFTPRIFRFHNITDRISDEWIEGMASASSIHTLANGTRSLETTNGIAVDSADSTVTLTAVTMAASKVFGWEAIG